MGIILHGIIHPLVNRTTTRNFDHSSSTDHSTSKLLLIIFGGSLYIDYGEYQPVQKFHRRIPGHHIRLLNLGTPGIEVEPS